MLVPNSQSILPPPPTPLATRGNKSVLYMSLSHFCSVNRFICVIFYIPQSFPHSSVSKESACNAGDLGFIPRLGRSPGETIGYPLQYSGLENSMDCIVHGLTNCQTQLNDFHFHFGFHI